MVRLFVRMNVADYETWRKVYDQFYGERSAMGVLGAAAPELSSRRMLCGTSCSVQASKASPRSGSPPRAGGQHRVSHQAAS
jgi:hypothetical protein